MRKTFPLISIIISNFNGMKLNILRECLESFKKVDYKNFELILVDNASTDNSVVVAKKIMGNDPRFKIIKNPVNNYSRGVNLAFDASKGEYIAMFNNDVVIEKNYLQKLLGAFLKYPKLAVVQGKMLWYFDHSIIDSAGETMDLYGNPVTLGYQEKDKGGFDKDEEVLSASGAACLIKKSALDKVGRYDSKYGIGYEDMDLCLRLRNKGFIIMRIPQAICYHKRGVTDLSSSVRVKVRWNFNKNRLLTMIRNYPLPVLLKALPITLLIYAGSMFWEILIGRGDLAWTRISSIGWVFFNLPLILIERLKIRGEVLKGSDVKTLKLFSRPNLFGKMRAVVAHKFV